MSIQTQSTVRFVSMLCKILRRIRICNHLRDFRVSLNSVLTYKMKDLRNSIENFVESI